MLTSVVPLNNAEWSIIGNKKAAVTAALTISY